MSAITLKAVQAKQSELATQHTELATMIKTLVDQAKVITVLNIAEVSIELQPGDRYAGPVLDADGTVKHHLVLMAEKPEGDLQWQAAMEWAASVGGSLPTRQEQALLFANCKPHLSGVWHWSCETHETNASFAWDCLFTSGYQDNDHKSAEGAAVAVRRA
jgi:hypothetical protein